MKKLLLALAFAGLGATSATAADLAAPPYNAVSPAWSVKGEYLYVDLGSESFNTNLAAGGFPLASFTHSVKLTESIGRLGLN